MSKCVALLGYPLGHSISPVFQQAAFDYCRLDVRYERWETETSYLQEAAGRLRQSRVLGANVTIPLKEAVMPLLDKVDQLAAQIGAVNTIVNREGKLFGYNTDASGFLRSLRQEGAFEPRGKRVALIGAGGAARAVAYALVRESVRKLTIVNRSAERAERLASSLGMYGGAEAVITTLPWEQAKSREALAGSDLIVNCTSLGMKHSPAEGEAPLAADSIPEDALVCDLVYNPIDTPLLIEARKSGARVLGGLAMLVYQGAESFRLWTDRQPPIDIMFKQANEALG